MRLIRDEIGDDAYQQENTSYRDAGRQLSEVRDAIVMIETLDMICEYFATQLQPGTFREIRDRLVETQQQTSYKVFEEERSIAKVLAMVEEAQARISTWPIEDRGYDFDQLVPGLKRVYKRGYRQLENAYSEPTPEHFHEWRKRVKYLWYHVRILKPIWPELMDALADDIHTLSDYLGDHHDLSELQQTVASYTDSPSQKSDVHALLPLINKRRSELETLAYPLGKRIYAEAPRQFTSRMARYWQAWQEGV